MRVKKVDKIS